jgi:hypothetical protein
VIQLGGAEGRRTVRGGSPWSDETPWPKLDTGTANSARVWNYLLGGKDNFAADRDAATTIAKMFPGIVHIARLQRRFLAGSVSYLAGRAGIRQFLDIGTGLPVDDNTHGMAQQVAPQCRIVYVDKDPLVLLHARALQRSAPGGAIDYVEADVRDTEEIISQAARTLDFGQPVAVMMLGLLGQLPDSADPGAIVARLLDRMPAGSHLALADGTDTSPGLKEAVATYNQNAANPYQLRSPQRIAGFFGGLRLVPPGVVSTSRWRPGRQDIGGQPPAVDAICGIGRKA